MNPKTDLRSAALKYSGIKISLIRQIKRRLWAFGQQFPRQRLSRRFGSNSLNLCNLRNLWIDDLWDLR
jgi:hypothetical protein